VFSTVLNPGDEIIVTRPYFLEYNNYVKNWAGKLVEVDAKPDFSLDPDAIAAKLNEKTAAVLVNSPNNPTGRIYSAESLALLAEKLNEFGKKTGHYPYLISDEPYRDLAWDGKHTPPLLCVYKNSVVCTSFSKNLSLPGERIGYTAVNPAAEEADLFVSSVTIVTRCLGFVNAPSLMQLAVAQMNDVKVDYSVYKGRLQAFKKVLDAAGIEYVEPEGAFYIWAKVPKSKKGHAETDEVFSEHLKKFLVLGVAGTSFAGPGWLRFAYCVDEKLITKSGEAFKKAMAEW
jgi:aspartate aminotransferase